MTSRNPSYVTKTKHGVFYFQKRVSSGLSVILGIKGNIYRRSLRTKDKNIALHRARNIWLSLDRLMIVQRCMGEEEMDKDLVFIDEQSEIARQQEIEHAQHIQRAVDWEDRYNAIPEWMVHKREAMIEFISPEDHRAMQYVSENEIKIDEFRKLSASVVASTQLAEQFRKRTDQSELLSELVNKYINSKERNQKNPRSVASYKNYLNTFVDIVGDKQSEDLTYSDVEKYAETLPKIPKNRNGKRFKGIAIPIILKKYSGDYDCLAINTLHLHGGAVRAFLEKHANKGFIDPRVPTALDEEFKTTEKERISNYDKSDLEKLFFSDEYVKGLHTKASNYWVPLLALFTGARSNELCQLLVSDIKEEEVDGNMVSYIDINQEEDKELKTEASIRKVPIHSTLLELRFLEYVNAVKKAGEKRLFTEIKIKNGKYNAALSRWFRETYKRRCGIENVGDKKKVFHSFRHTTVNHLWDEKKVDLSKVGALVGHTKKTMTDGYTHGLSMKVKSELIEIIDFGLDFSRIRLWQGCRFMRR